MVRESASDETRLSLESSRNMGTTTIDLQQLLLACFELAELSGEIIRQVASSGNLGTLDKGGGVDNAGQYVADPQTKADRDVEALIIASLRRAFPALIVIGEESSEGHHIPDSAAVDLGLPGTSPAPIALFASADAGKWQVASDRVAVWIDPLDGTSEYTRGNLAAVTCLIGIAVDGVPFAGVIHQPFYTKDGGRTVWGGAGLGIDGLVADADAAKKRPAAAGLVVGTNRTARDPLIEKALAALDPSQVVRESATGRHVLSILEGKEDAFVLTRAGTKKWDLCAGAALLAEVGGAITDCSGKVYRFDSAAPHANEGGVIAAASAQGLVDIVAAVRPAIQPFPDNIPANERSCR